MTEVHSFLQSLSDANQQRATHIVTLEQHLHRVVWEARQTWSHLALSPDVFLGSLATLWEQVADSQPLEPWLESIHAPDLYLACACACNHSDALQAFEERYRGLLYQTVRRYASSQHPEEDLLQVLREKLFVETEKRPAKIRSYGGLGPLHSWLRVTALRTFLDCVRTGAQQKREQGDHNDLLLNVPDEQLDIEMDFLKREYRTQFKDAFAEALQHLDSSERNLLRLHFVSGLNIDQIGVIYHIHRATAARRLARARQSLFSETRKRMMQRLKLSDHEFESLMGMIQSRLEVSLHRLLQSSIS